MIRILAAAAILVAGIVNRANGQNILYSPRDYSARHSPHFQLNTITAE